MTTVSRPRRPRWLRWVLWGLASVVLAIVVAAVALKEVRDLALYRVAPRYARDANLVRFVRGPREVILLGTIHGRHLSCGEYSLAHLKAAMIHLAPARLLVEARPAELAAGRWGDGPIEMPYAALTARARGIRVGGIDWWEISGSARRTNEVRDDKIYRNMVDQLPARGTALVLVGYAHVPELARRLERAGFAGRPIAADRKAQVFELLDEPFTYPSGMARAIAERIARAEARAASESGEIARQFRSLAAARRLYLAEIKRVGEASAPVTTKPATTKLATTRPAATRPAAVIPPPPLGTIDQITALSRRFVRRARRARLILDFEPEIRQWTRPSLISWRQEAKAVAVPRWVELSKGQQKALAQMAGGAGSARQLFGWLFRWFFVPHELTHALQVNLGKPSDHASSERLANDLAVAFLAEQPDGPARLATLRSILKDVIPRLPALPAGDLDRYFNDHYHELGQQPSRYGAFQLRFVSESLARVEDLSFDLVAARIARR